MIDGVMGLIRFAAALITVVALGGVGCGGPAGKMPVRLRLWLSGEVVGHFRAAIGHDVTISAAGQPAIQLTPSLDTRSLVLRLRSESDAPGGAGAGAQGVLHLDHSRPVSIRETALAIEWLRDDGPQDAPPARPCTRCCVTCGGVSICACSVTMACGSCACDGGGCAASQQLEFGPALASAQLPAGGHARKPAGATAGARAQLVSKKPGAQQ